MENSISLNKKKFEWGVSISANLCDIWLKPRVPHN